MGGRVGQKKGDLGRYGARAWAQMTRPKVEFACCEREKHLQETSSRTKVATQKHVYYIYLYMILVVDSSANSF